MPLFLCDAPIIPDRAEKVNAKNNYFGKFDTFLSVSLDKFPAMFYNKIVMNTECLANLTVSKIHFVACIHTEANKGARRKNRPVWAAIFKFEGETVYESGGKTIISNRENAVLLPRNSSYDWKCLRAGRFYDIEFDCDCPVTEPLSFPVQNSEKLLRLFKEAEYKFTLKNSVYKLEVFRNVYEILANLLKPDLQKSYQSAKKREKIALALDYIAKNYRRKITNAELAALCGMSEVYFRKAFTAIAGDSPIGYVRNLRMKKAAELLKTDFVSLSDAAISLGFADISEFSRAFRKYAGISPREYVKSLNRACENLEITQNNGENL